MFSPSARDRFAVLDEAGLEAGWIRLSWKSCDIKSQISTIALRQRREVGGGPQTTAGRSGLRDDSICFALVPMTDYKLTTPLTDDAGKLL